MANLAALCFTYQHEYSSTVQEYPNGSRRVSRKYVCVPFCLGKGHHFSTSTIYNYLLANTAVRKSLEVVGKCLV